MSEERPEALTHSLLAAAPHGFFTRRGGVSEGPYASLNASLSGGDDRERVAENRGRAARALGLDPASLSGLHQVHGAEVAVLEAPVPHGRGPRADGMVTARRGVTLAVVTADCGPVLLADEAAGVVGACHAGWRGAVGGVVEATVSAMEALGARRGRLRAALGPCLRQPSYEVGPDLRDALLVAEGEGGERFLAPGTREDRWQFDMAGLILVRLSRLGVEAGARGEDTGPDAARFFSHRRRTLSGGGPIGHQLSLIALA